MGVRDGSDRETRDIVMATEANLFNIEKKIDALILGQSNTHLDHETRIRSLEKSHWKLVAILTAIWGFIEVSWHKFF
jgi:hypothetical protein